MRMKENIMFKKFYNKYFDRNFSQNYELQKYEYYNDLEYDFLKYLEDLSHEDQSESNSKITYTLKVSDKEQKYFDWFKNY